jgi:predicted DNA binding CopG/RHH family protein
MTQDTITKVHVHQDWRKRARKPASKKLSKTVVICMTEREHSAYKRKADSKGLAISTYLRLLISKRAKVDADNTIDDSDQK